MVRSPCCEKVGLKKGPWTPEEDNKLSAYVEEHGHGSWRALPAKAGLQRCGKSCRLRWTNYLRPGIKRGKFSTQEEQTIIQLHALLGNRWAAIASYLDKRTDNEVKNHWNTHLKKRLDRMGIDPKTHKPKSSITTDANGQTSSSKEAATLSHMAQWESARLEAEARLVRDSNPKKPPHKRIPLPVRPKSTTNRPRCLDILRAWQDQMADKGGPALESPTSIFSFPPPTPAAAAAAPTAGELIEWSPVVQVPSFGEEAVLLGGDGGISDVVFGPRGNVSDVPNPPAAAAVEEEGSSTTEGNYCYWNTLLNSLAYGGSNNGDDVVFDGF